MSIVRNYSFAAKDSDRFDFVLLDGKEVPIPAHIGSTYWAILKVMYSNPDVPIHFDRLAAEVAALMKDRDDEGWTSFEAKPDARPWQERIVMSARLLTRTSGNHPYGLRTREQGFVLKLDRDALRKPFLILQRETEYA